MSATRRLDHVALSEIKRARRNPKRHDAAEIEASLHRFGVGELPLIDERTGLLVAGEGRIRQLEAMYAADPGQPPDGVQIDPGGGEWLVPVIRGWASADDHEADAYLIMSNRLSERGGWDLLGLADMLVGLDGDLDGVGYSPEEIDALIAESGYLPEDADALAELDTAPLHDLLTEPEPEPEPGPQPVVAAPRPAPGGVPATMPLLRAPDEPEVMTAPGPAGPARPLLNPFDPTGLPAPAPPPQAAPAHTGALPPRSAPAAGGTEPQWFQLTWSATHAQRESIHEAIRLARDRFKADSSVAALAAVCQAYVDGVTR